MISPSSHLQVEAHASHWHLVWIACHGPRAVAVTKSFENLRKAGGVNNRLVMSTTYSNYTNTHSTNQNTLGMGEGKVHTQPEICELEQTHVEWI